MANLFVKLYCMINFRSCQKKLSRCFGKHTSVLLIKQNFEKTDQPNFKYFPVFLVKTKLKLEI